MRRTRIGSGKINSNDMTKLSRQAVGGGTWTLTCSNILSCTAICTGTAVSDHIHVVGRTVVWGDGRGNPPSYPIPDWAPSQFLSIILVPWRNLRFKETEGFFTVRLDD